MTDEITGLIHRVLDHLSRPATVPERRIRAAALCSPTDLAKCRAAVRVIRQQYPHDGWENLNDGDLALLALDLVFFYDRNRYCQKCPGRLGAGRASASAQALKEGIDRCSSHRTDDFEQRNHCSVITRARLCANANGEPIVRFGFGACCVWRALREQETV